MAITNSNAFGVTADLNLMCNKSFSVDDFKTADLFRKLADQDVFKCSVGTIYEIAAVSIFEAVVAVTRPTKKTNIQSDNEKLLGEFYDLTKLLLGVETGIFSWQPDVCIYRVGAVGEMDPSLNMLLNTESAIQVKYLSLDGSFVQPAVRQVESDHIVIVCRDVDAKVIEVVAKQINWGRRVRGIVSESELIAWYERCLRGDNSALLVKPLLKKLSDGFKAEFPQAGAMVAFLEERNYLSANPDKVWAF